jgi:hypothetical protein
MASTELAEVLHNYKTEALNVSDDTRPVFNALANVGALIIGWYPNATFGREEMLTWSYLLDGYDPELFVPAIAEYAKTNPDWPPSAPQFRIVVDELTRRRHNDEMRRRNEAALTATVTRLISEAETVNQPPA